MVPLAVTKSGLFPSQSGSANIIMTYELKESRAGLLAVSWADCCTSSVQTSPPLYPVSGIFSRATVPQAGAICRG